MKTVITNSHLNLEKCVGCKTCTHVCPTKAYTPAISRPLEKIKISPCTVECPIGNDIEGFNYLVGQKKYGEAYDLLRETNPLPGATGRVCNHPCEKECNRIQFDEGVSIKSVERFIADTAMKAGYKPVKPKVVRMESVAVVGSGPAGLSCAYHLGRMGYRVTVFEGARKTGGMLRYGIPEYRLPKKVLDNEIRYIEESGVDIKTNTPVKNAEDLFGQGYKAIFVATGSWTSHKVGVPGEETAGVLHAVDFLTRANSGEKVKMGNCVAVIGGGNVAIDSARLSRRLGAKEVHMICLESTDLSCKDRMPAQDVEIEEAEGEGVTIHPCLGIRKILADQGKIVGLETVQCTSVINEQGRFAPEFGNGVAPTIAADMVIVAIGQRPDDKDFAGLERNPAKTIKVDSMTFETNIKGIFAGGDAVRGAGTVSEAIGAGKKAALAIHRFLEKGDAREVAAVREVVTYEEMNRDYFYPVARNKAGHLDLGQAVLSFDEVSLGYQEDQGVNEAQRCFGCAAPPTFTFEQCIGCLNCMDRCPVMAITLDPLKEPYTVAVDASQFAEKEIMRICKKVHIHPKQIICYCNVTRAEEVVAAILKGAKTPEDISRMTGARTGCAVLCIQSIVKLLEAAGFPVTLGSTHQTYGKTFTLWDLDPELKKKYEARGFHFDDDIKLIETVFKSK
ncbi:MAG TPA: FAD-dependent oxidoreductase [Syntrophales bacterium]|nr:FAD-dependent oxidoreductase [Syntrophales bacterium]